MFKYLTPEERAAFQQYAKNNLPGRSDWSLFHPACREVWWELACQHDDIDPTDNFIVFSKENPYFQEGSTKCRFAMVRIEATVDYLTANDEESEADGWSEVEARLTDYLRGFNRFQDKSVPDARFMKWEDSDA